MAVSITHHPPVFTPSLTDLQRDILLKASESIKEGMWCRNQWFAPGRRRSYEGIGAYYPDAEAFLLCDAHIPIEERLAKVANSYRCAEGELAFQTGHLGGNYDDYRDVLSAVTRRLHDVCFSCRALEATGMVHTLSLHNDVCLAQDESEETATNAAHSLSDLFRKVATS